MSKRMQIFFRLYWIRILGVFALIVILASLAIFPILSNCTDREGLVDFAAVGRQLRFCGSRKQ